MKEIYLDNAATTKVDKSVLKEIMKFNEKCYGNPSGQYSFGRRVRADVEKARGRIANFIGAESEEIIFTSGGTESNNFAIKGLALANPNKKHIITSLIEHPAILESCHALEKQGYEIDYIGVDAEGIVDVKDVMRKIRKDTLVVSIMHVNNEIGTIQPVREIGKICREKKVYFHTDAVQSFKKLDIDVNSMNIDLLSVSGHKINGPKGIGFLYVKLGTRIKPIIDGGGQEFKLRGGTENSTGILALAKALELNQDDKMVRKVRDFMVDELKKIRGVRFNGSLKNKIWNNISVSFYGIEGESLMLMLDEENIFVSTGSACASHKLEESYVLKAINVDDLYIHGTIRITMGNDVSMNDAKVVVAKIAEKVARLREMSPFKLEDMKDD
jgi:cysteine desulfurase